MHTDSRLAHLGAIVALAVLLDAQLQLLDAKVVHSPPQMLCVCNHAVSARPQRMYGEQFSARMMMGV